MRRVATIDKTNEGYVLRLYNWKSFGETEPIRNGLYIVKTKDEVKLRLKELGVTRILEPFGTVSVAEGLKRA